MKFGQAMGSLLSETGVVFGRMELYFSIYVWTLNEEFLHGLEIWNSARLLVLYIICCNFDGSNYIYV